MAVKPIAFLLLAFLAGAYLSKFWILLVTNTNFPWALDVSSLLAVALIFLLSLVGGGLYSLAIGGVFRATRSWFVVVFASTLLVGWALFPISCDTHESFVDQPNKTCECAGATLTYYPQGVMDGTEIEYCIGLERVH